MPHDLKITHTDIHSTRHRLTCKHEIHSVRCPTSMSPIQPVDVTITQKLFRGVPADGPALELCASGGNSESDSQMLMWLLPHLSLPGHTKTHTHIHRLCKVFIPLPWNSISPAAKSHSLLQTAFQKEVCDLLCASLIRNLPSDKPRT